eukprot:jgi/Psemu1/313634/fgenesh1_kg.1252_\
MTDDSISAYLKTLEEVEEREDQPQHENGAWEDRGEVEDHRSTLEPNDDREEAETEDETISGFFRAMEEEGDNYRTTTSRGSPLLEPGDEVDDAVDTVSTNHRSTLEPNDDRDEAEAEEDETISGFFRAMEEERDNYRTTTSRGSPLLEPGDEEEDAEDTVSTILRDIIQDEPLKSNTSNSQTKTQSPSFRLEDSYYFNESGTVSKPRPQQQRSSGSSSLSSPDEKAEDRGPLTVEERRLRRLKQRHKFEKVLLGEDDSSATSTSTATASLVRHHHHHTERAEKEDETAATAAATPATSGNNGN